MRVTHVSANAGWEGQLAASSGQLLAAVVRPRMVSQSVRATVGRRQQARSDTTSKKVDNRERGGYEI
jgi:hypothetical protein